MGFEAFEYKFDPFERDSKHLNVNSNILKGIRGIWTQIITIRKGFEAFEWLIESDSKHLNAV